MTERLDPYEIYADDESPAQMEKAKRVSEFVSASLSRNIEGAPTLRYELWDRKPHTGVYDFKGERVLSLRQVLKYIDFGYTVVRSRGDRSGTIPLFPVVGASGSYPGDGLDPVPVSEP